jgi:flagella basal body P-ring formation protein FlgA
MLARGNTKYQTWIVRAVTSGVITLLVIGPLMGHTLRDRIEQEAVSFLSHNVTAPHDSVAITIGLPALSVSTDGIRDFGFDLLSAKPVIGTVPIKITLFLNEGVTQSLTATARVRIYDTVAVSAHRLGRHETLAPDDIRLERREVTHLADAYFSDPSGLIGKRTRRLASAGKILTASDVERIPLVKRGSGVMVSVVIGAVTVSSKAKALEDGCLGDHIRVQDIATRKRLTGIVANERLVILDASAL